MKEVSNMYYYSWEIVNDSVAIKHCDKSYFEHHGTGIPRETRSFWGIEPLVNGDRKEIALEYEGKEYAAHFQIDPLNRARMFWNTDLQAAILSFNNPEKYPLAKYEKINTDRYRLTIIGEEIEENVVPSLSDEFIKEIAKSRESREVKTRTVTSVQKTRDPYISEYAKRRANGICQLCGNPAPFVDSKGKPYLETHHIIWLSHGGEDTIENTVALCPNCHKKMHIVNVEADIEFLMDKNKSL